MNLSEVKREVDLLIAALGLDTWKKGKLSNCPYHEDSKPSLSVFQRDGIWFWKCHAGCGSGTIIDAAMHIEGVNTPSEACRYIERELGVKIRKDEEYQEPVIDEDRAERLIQKAHSNLMDSFELQEKYMFGKRGIYDLDIVVRFRLGFIRNLGFEGWRSWRFDAWVIPITNKRGRLLGIKIHSERKNCAESPKAFWAPFGTYPKDDPKHGVATLWPAPELYHGPDDLYLCPGELKAIAMIGAGMSAVSITGGEGASKFKQHLMNRLLKAKPKRVIITYDDDRTGRNFAEIAGSAIEKETIPVIAIEYSSPVETTPNLTGSTNGASEPTPNHPKPPPTSEEDGTLIDPAEAAKELRSLLGPAELEPAAPPEPSLELVELTGWFRNNFAKCPQEPFNLGPAVSISDPSKFYRQIWNSIQSPAESPRARIGALQSELRALRAGVEAGTWQSAMQTT